MLTRKLNFRFVDSCLNLARRSKAGIATSTSGANIAVRPTEEEEESEETEPLSKSSPLVDLIKRMKDPATGLPFFSKTKNLPDHSFLSYDAIAWLLRWADANSVSLL